MDLAISIGNSTLRMATVCDQQISNVWQINSKTEDVAGALTNILALLDEAIDRCIIASVNPGLTDMVSSVVRSVCRLEPVFATLERGFLLDYSCYEGLLGIDRALCCEAAFQQIKPPFIVVDLGTATTLNVVDENNRFLGGLIYPGVQMGLAALANDTALLPHVQLETVIPLIGQNTKECLLAGAVYGTAMFLDKALAHLWSALGTTGTTVVTGGHAALITPRMETRHLYDQHLVLKGLLSVLKHY